MIVDKIVLEVRPDVWKSLEGPDLVNRHSLCADIASNRDVALRLHFVCTDPTSNGQWQDGSIPVRLAFRSGRCSQARVAADLHGRHGDPHCHCLQLATRG